MGMLRAGEYSPNHPDIALTSRAYEGAKQDVFVGLGMYEERRKELLLRRQKEYRDYLAKQRNMNALTKQQSHLSSPIVPEHFHLPHHQVNQDHLKSFLSPAGGWQGEHRNSQPLKQHQVPEDVFQFPHHQVNQEHLESFLSPAGGWKGEGVGRNRRPSSVAVQTDPEDLSALERRLTRAERELSPRHPSTKSLYQFKEPPSTSGHYQPQEQFPPQDWRMLVEKVNIGTQNNLIVPTGNKYLPSSNQETYQGDYFDTLNGVGKNIYRKDSPRARLLQDLKHTYMPSLFDEDTIKQRNTEMEQDAAAKRTAYQLELKKQIEEQQRIKEEKKIREKMMEEAETRRLEEQLKLLKLSQETEIEKQQQMTTRIRKDSNEFQKRRLKLQNDIENERKAMRATKNQTKIHSEIPNRTTQSNPATLKNTQNNDVFENRSNLPFYHTSPRLENEEMDSDILSFNIRRNNPHLGQDPPPKRVPYSTNIPDNSVFAQSIPVKNYNANDVTTLHRYPQRKNNEIKERPKRQNIEIDQLKIKEDIDKFNSQHSTVRNLQNKNHRPSYEPAFLSKNITELIDTRNLTKNRNYEANFDDSLPIPVLREPEKSVRIQNEFLSDEQYNSEAMMNVEQKWKVPAVQKNILKNNFTEDGKQENILTQLGSIRRQLQLEQLKLDQSQMFPNKKLVK